ncbi:substrate-binding periplasmic protein [Chitinibacter tainanensis]|uniref:substrate-binding periplasmic protein n=1 Tax=Chitinibacter tainanensis TaxID=230667 RepID=UPI0003F74893|nr:transporter substrate-binding domain-containing protein [Chitinibacter tainanensis]
MLLLASLSAAPVAASDCQSGLKVGWETWEPFHYQDEQGQMRGYAVEVLNEMARRSQCKLVYLQRPWVRTLTELASGELDIAMEALKTPEREQYAYFSGPYSPTIIQLMYNMQRQKRWQVSALKDLTQYPGLRIGVARGDSFGKEIDAWLAKKPPGILVDVAPTMQANLQKLALNRVDLVFTSSLSAEAVLRDFKLKHIAPLPVSWAVEDAHFAYSKQGMDEATVAQLNAALEAMRKDGTLKQLMQLYRH